MTSENYPIKAYQFARSDLPIESDERIRATSENGTEVPMTVENTTIEERCGLEDIDTIAVGLLVLAPLDQVAEVVAQLGVRWERDVYGQSVQGCGLFVFQFREHPWIGILDGYMTDHYRDILNGYVDNWNWELQAQSLSQHLHTQTIYYWVDDSGCTIGYAYWDNGELMERLEFDESIWQDTHEVDAPEGTFEPHLFESKLREITAAEIKYAYAFVDDFLCERQAYAATRLSHFNIQRDDFERIDYIAFA